MSPPHPAYGHAVSRAYSEMSIGLRCCIHRYAQAQRAFLADAAALADKAEVALLKALASAASPTSVAAAEAAIRAAVASADTTLAPPSILVSRRNPLASTCLIAAAASPTFLPVKDLLEHTARAARDAAREVDRSLEARLGGRVRQGRPCLPATRFPFVSCPADPRGAHHRPGQALGCG